MTSNHCKTTGYSPKLAKIIVISSVVLALSFCIFLFMPTSAKGSNEPRYKYFKSITIESGESLWSIAKEYMSEEYDSIYDYISELKSMNGLTDDTIHAGNNLVVSYYSEELK